MPTIRLHHQDIGNDTSATLIAEHYQYTFELAYKYWRERNRLFVAMLGMLGFTALTSTRSEAGSLLVIGIANALGVQGEGDQMAALQDSLPIALVNGVFLGVIAMLVFLVYQRTRYLKALYAYLGELESELRSLLELPPTSTAFTRESDFYRKHSGVFAAHVLGAAYLSFSGVALGAVVGLRLIQDVQLTSSTSFVVELAFGSAAILFFLGYVREEMWKKRP
ncbi:hypothetical protein B0I32_109301 [Nonomuraea fuscirosea]|uniref:Uncharacterized protein n=1 Tax=Nonomuraea fuscirosea TaxID=1291556 RepID=A0A2T0MYN8_9ACTN|nr:hypothetical protein [Nonomuraea fuscirosea]PRX64372.1 hypothetical protein B0I32_109301 [Nonomuraea fuscirosea]